MAYNDEALRAKLTTLNETQESIVAVSQWIQFHRKYADKIASVWLTRLREVQPTKRLNYIYLVNDIVQNAKARKRQEFPNAFSPLMPEAVQQAYKSVSVDVQNKIKRVLDVWRQRAVFDESILQAIQARVEDVDKTKPASGTKKSLMGNSLFSSSTTSLPKELETLGPLQSTISKTEATCRPLIESAQSADSTLRDPQATKPTPPVYAARLSDLLKKLATAEASLTETIGARQKLIADLKRILEKNEGLLAQDERLQLELSAKKTTAEADKRAVEDQIMQNLSTTDMSEDVDDRSGDYTRPDVEELTPEPDNFSPSDLQPARNPALQGLLAGFTSADIPSYSAQDTTEQGFMPPTSFTPDVEDRLSQLQYASKKRKLSHDNGISSVPDFGPMGFESSTDPYATHTTLEQDVDALIQGHQPQGTGGFPQS